MLQANIFLNKNRGDVLFSRVIVLPLVCMCVPEFTFYLYVSLNTKRNINTIYR